VSFIIAASEVVTVFLLGSRLNLGVRDIATSPQVVLARYISYTIISASVEKSRKLSVRINLSRRRIWSYGPPELEASGVPFSPYVRSMLVFSHLCLINFDEKILLIN